MATSGIPGGKGPNRATEFVVPRGSFADGVVPGGHFLFPLQRVQITRVEQITSPDHYTRLFFGRAAPVAPAVPGQPWYLWPPIKVTIEPEEKMYRENHDLSLYPFRPHQSSFTQNLHRLVMDINTGRLGWMVSGTHTGVPIIVVFLD